MSGVDEFTALEESAQEIELNLNRAREVIRQNSRKALELRQRLQSVDANLAGLEARIAFMKNKARIVLLSEYEVLAYQRDQVMEFKVTCQEDIQKLNKQSQEVQKTIPGLEQQLKEILGRFKNFGKVIPVPS
jgi:chromosome segregation ATPase